MGVTEDAEKRFERAMQRLLYDKASTSPPTPAASSAGASSPAKGNPGADVRAVGQASVAGFSTRPPRAAVSTSTGVMPTPVASKPVCRPWDRGDLLKRLATFKSITWFGKPQVAGPVSCARRGWVNVDVDLLACESCGARLSFTIPPTWSRAQAESAAEVFAEQLDTGHKSLCAWKGNACADTLAQFPPTPLAALVEGYNDRCEALTQLSALPVIAGAALEQISATRAKQLDRLFAQPPPMLPGGQSGYVPDVAGGDSGGAANENAVLNAYFQSQRVISLCGWEPRLLPYTVDCEERSAPVGQSEGLSRTPRDPGPSVLLNKKSSPAEEKQETGSVKRSKPELGDPASAVLDCSLCGASVGLWSFAAVSRPSPILGAVHVELPETRGNFLHALGCGASAMSGIEGRCGGESRQVHRPEKQGMAVEKESGPAKMTGERFTPLTGRTLDLSLTIAGGPPPTQLSSPAMVPPAFGPIPGIQQRFGQPESSEMGEWAAASYESRGPRDPERGVGHGGSTVDASQSRQIQADSAEGTVVDHEGDEVDYGEVGKRKRSVTESSKRKRTGESSAVDQVSRGAAVTGPHSTEKFRNKRPRNDQSGNFGVDRFLPGPSGRDLPRSSSVNAIDTCYQNKQDNSMESVDNLPQDSDGQGTAVSVEKNECDGQVEGGRSLLQAQQSICRSTQNTEPDSSKSDEGGGEEGGDTNAAIISTGTGTGGGVSIGMGGGSVGMGASHEAEIQGEIYGADVSVQGTESVAGDVEFVTEVTENHALMGNFVPDVRGDSHEAIHSAFQGRAQAEGSSPAEGESGENNDKDSQGGHTEIEGTRDTANAVIMDDDSPEKEVTDGSMGAAIGEDKHSAARPVEDMRIWDTKEQQEFDPIRQHRHFCPWVNGQVAAAGTSSSGGLCGWQVTIDALDTLQTQDHPPAGMTESESTASMYKANPLVSVRKLLGEKQSLQRQSSRVNS